MKGMNVSKCSRPAKPVRGFKSLLLRQKTRGFPQFEGSRFFSLCAEKTCFSSLFSSNRVVILDQLLWCFNDEIQSLDHSLS